MMSLSVRRTSDEVLCILAWQLPRVAAMADTCIFLRLFPTRKQSGKTIDGFDVTPLESTVGHIQGLMEACLPPESCSFGRRTISARNITRYFQDMPFPAIQNPTEVVNYTGAVLEASNVDLSRLCLGGVTDGSSLGAIFNHFTGKFDLSPSSQTANKTAEQKEKSCIAAATVANKEVAAYNMVSNQFVQDHFHMPSLVAYDSPELLESSSRSVHRKRTPLDDPRTSQVIPEATSKKVTASVGTDHRKAVVVIVIRDTASQPLNTEPIPTNGAATQSKPTSGRVQTDRPVLNAARNQTTNHAHGTSGERSSSVRTKGKS
ncbi:hypothetical protein Tco_0323113 [Tanacetum coccineum]